MRDSFLVDGVAFKKTFSYAGFEQQPKKFLNPKILLLNIELELKSEKENAEIRLEFWLFMLIFPFKCICWPYLTWLLPFFSQAVRSITVSVNSRCRMEHHL